MKKLTDWHPPHVKPVHVGVYPTLHFLDDPALEHYNKWNGEFWCGCEENVEAANNNTDKGTQELSWRGYTTKQD